MRAYPYGEGGLFVDLELEGDPRRADRTLAAVRAFRAAFPHADVVAGGGVFAAFGVGTFEDADAAIVDSAHAAAAAPDARPNGREVEVSVLYDGEDLETVAASLRVSPREIVALHTKEALLVEIVGFMPGFAYLSGLDEALHLPRRATPRPRVPARSVAVAGGFSGIYPAPSPGGWHLLGRTDLWPFDQAREQALAFELGDRVRFVETDQLATATSRAPLPPSGQRGRGLVMTRVAALATVQDAGRSGQQAAGVPSGGAWDPTALACANLAVGNAPGEAAIEIAGGSVEVRAERALVVSVDGDAPRTLREGETFVVPTSERFARYLAVAGGVAGHLSCGSRGASPAVGLGPPPLRRGDVIDIDARVGAAPRARPSVEDPGECPTLLIDPGPHWRRFAQTALDALVDGVWVRGARGDRVGVRIEGQRLDTTGTALSLPVPMVRGAIEVPPDGMPIVLGPDHPTTGGYPVVAVLRRASQGILARLRVGQAFRLALG